MNQFPQSLRAWNTPVFQAVLKQEIEQLDAGCLPLQRGLSSSSYVTDRPFQAMIISVNEEAGLIRAKAGIFTRGSLRAAAAQTTRHLSTSRPNTVWCGSTSTARLPKPR